MVFVLLGLRTKVATSIDGVRRVGFALGTEHLLGVAVVRGHIEDESVLLAGLVHAPNRNV